MSSLADGIDEKAKDLLAVFFLVLFVCLRVQELLGFGLLTSIWCGFVRVGVGLYVNVGITVLNCEGSRVFGLFRQRHSLGN